MLENLEREIALRLSLFGVSLASAYLHIALKDNKAVVIHLLNAKGHLDDALALLTKETEAVYA